jgi:hypothetical protein
MMLIIISTSADWVRESSVPSCSIFSLALLKELSYKDYHNKNVKELYQSLLFFIPGRGERGWGRGERGI